MVSCQPLGSCAPASGSFETMQQVAVLFARVDSVYKTLPGCDVWDAERDALQWPEGCPLVAHPPCRAWGRLRHFAKPQPGEKELSMWAVSRVRENGGVLEHPIGSCLWRDMLLPPAGDGPDEFGGWTLPVSQYWWGHLARKSTLLYIVGCQPKDIPNLPIDISQPAHSISWNKHSSRGAERFPDKHVEDTPQAFAKWLVELARRCVGSADD